MISEKNRHEHDMTLSQQFGMITVKNVVRSFLDAGIDFNIFTLEVNGHIYKKFSHMNSFIIDDFGEVDTIIFELKENEETRIQFFNIYDEILEVDNFKGFELIIEAINSRIKKLHIRGNKRNNRTKYFLSAKRKGVTQ